MKALVQKCVAGAKVGELCAFGDTELQAAADKVYRKDKEMKKGKIPAFLTVLYSDWTLAWELNGSSM